MVIRNTHGREVESKAFLKSANSRYTHIFALSPSFFDGLEERKVVKLGGAVARLN